MKYSQVLDYSQNRAKLLNSIKATKQFTKAVELADNALEQQVSTLNPQENLTSMGEIEVMRGFDNPATVIPEINLLHHDMVAEQDTLNPVAAFEAGLAMPVATIRAQFNDFNLVCAGGSIEYGPGNSQLKALNITSSIVMEKPMDRFPDSVRDNRTTELGKRDGREKQLNAEVIQENSLRSKIVKASLFQAPGESRLREEIRAASGFSRPSVDHPRFAGRLLSSKNQNGEAGGRSTFFNLTDGEPEGIVLKKPLKTSTREPKKPFTSFKHRSEENGDPTDFSQLLAGGETGEVVEVESSEPTRSVRAVQKKQMDDEDLPKSLAEIKEVKDQNIQETLPQEKQQQQFKLDQVLTTPMMILPTKSLKTKGSNSDLQKSRHVSTEHQHEVSINKHPEIPTGAKNASQHGESKGRSERSIGSSGLMEVDLATALASGNNSQTVFTKHEVDKVQRHLNTLAEGLQTVCEKSLTASRREGVYKKTLYFVHAMFELDDPQLRCLLTNRVGPYLTVIKRFLTAINETSSPEFCHLSISLDQLLTYIKNKTRNYVGFHLMIVHHKEIQR
jgi:hypothetical protein